jgi:hypothetical protein
VQRKRTTPGPKSEKSTMSRRTVERAISELIDAGLIVRTRRPVGRQVLTNFQPNLELVFGSLEGARRRGYEPLAAASPESPSLSEQTTNVARNSTSLFTSFLGREGEVLTPVQSLFPFGEGSVGRLAPAPDVAGNTPLTSARRSRLSSEAVAVYTQTQRALRRSRPHVRGRAHAIRRSKWRSTDPRRRLRLPSQGADSVRPEASNDPSREVIKPMPKTSSADNQTASGRAEAVPPRGRIRSERRPMTVANVLHVSAARTSTTAGGPMVRKQLSTRRDED